MLPGEERTCRMLSKPALALREATSVLIISSGSGEPSEMMQSSYIHLSVMTPPALIVA